MPSGDFSTSSALMVVEQQRFCEKGWERIPVSDENPASGRQRNLGEEHETAHYSFARIYKTLPITPAMAADRWSIRLVSNYVWSVEQTVLLANERTKIVAQRPTLSLG